ncbi:ABC transporter permease [Rathayibacter sp. CAU 1779]
MSATAVLLRFRLRRDRIVVPVWIVVMAFSVLFVAAALASTYNTESLRVAVIRLAAVDPTLLALRGDPDGPSAGSFFVMEIGAYLLILVGFMNTFLAVRHTRADEQAGRAELVLATRASRPSMTASTLVLAVIANVGVGLFGALAAMATGYDGPGSIVLGWALATTGLAFFGIGLLFGQIFSTSRAANGWGSAAVGLFWVVAAAGNAAGKVSSDGLHVTPGAAIWFTPIGWGLRTLPYTQNLWWPGLLSLALAAVLIVVSVLLQGVRDTGAGLVAARLGRGTASAVLRGPIGLAWRLQRGSIIGWGIGAVLGGAAIGGLGKTLNDSISQNKDLSKAIEEMGSGNGTVFEVFIGVMIALIGLVVAGAAIQTAMRMRQEEAATTAELVLATPVSRLRWFVSYVVVGLVASAVILALAGIVAGSALASIDQNLVGQTILLSIAQLPAVAVYMGVTALVFAVIPRLTIAAGWIVFGVGVVLGEFGSLLNLPDWVRQVAPTAHTAVPPMSSADWSGTWWLVGIAVVAFVLAGIVFTRRDLVSHG